MATITKRVNKDGTVAYRIQVYVKNKATGKATTKVTTWNKPNDMSEREANKEVSKCAMNFEERIRNEKKLETDVSFEIKLIDFIPIWLESIKKNNSLSYYASMCEVTKYIGERIGNYKLKELNPTRIQLFIDDLDNIKLKKQSAVAKPMLRTKFNLTKLSREQFGLKYGMSHRTIGTALLGRAVDLASASKISKVLGYEIDDLFDYKKERAGVSQSSKARFCRTLRAILALAKRKQIIPENYAKGDFVRLVPEPKSKVECMDEAEIKLFIKGLQSEQDIRIKTALTTLVMMGLRRGELCGLQWDDIDFENETISIVRSSIAIAGYGIITGKPKTETSTRTILMPHTLTGLLKEYKEFWDMFTESLIDGRSSNRLFLQADGNNMYPGSIRYWLNKSLKKYGIEKHYTVHSLRHSNITMQIMSGVPLKTVSGRAGHSSTKVTSEVYSHFMRSSDIEAASKLDEMFT